MRGGGVGWGGGTRLGWGMGEWRGGEEEVVGEVRGGGGEERWRGGRRGRLRGG